ncbi:alpha-1-acid glycoprotein 2-like [Sylvia atricapilla]|uniref:alpha-1-acid glycoprotein 2-like n=1 Tax=Sylvia atricapilla TaxID=48155 RepID=UPI00339AD5E0
MPEQAAQQRNRHTATAWQGRSILLDSQERLATLTVFLGLPLALATKSQSCAPLVLVTFDNSTIPQILGQWFYIAGASRYPPHLEVMKAVTFEAFSFSPGSYEDELNITEIIAQGMRCVVRNSSKVQVFQENSTLKHVDDNQVASVARLIQSDKDLLILNHINIDFKSQNLHSQDPCPTSRLALALELQ